MIRYFNMVACATALCILAPNAYAEDFKMYPGTMCSFTNGGFEAKWGHALRNIEASDLWATCPIVRDEHYWSDDMEWAGIWVFGDVDDCKFERRPAGYGSVVGWNHSSIVNLGGGRKLLRWFEGDSEGNLGTDDAIGIVCKLPPNAGIYSYKILEE